MWILGALEGFDIDLDRVAVLIDDNAVGHCQQCAVGLFVIKREGGLVPAAPVVLEFAASPLLLELGLAGVLGSGVVEVPGVVGVDVVAGGGILVVAQLTAAGILLGEVLLSGGILGLFLLLLLELLDNLGDDGFLLLGCHGCQLEQRVLQGHIL